MRQLLLFPPYWRGNWGSEGLNDILQSQSQDPKSSISDPKSVFIYFLSAPGEKTICFRRETITHLGKVDWILVWYDRGCDGRLAIPHFYPLSHLRAEPEENKEYFPGARLKGRWQSLWSRVAWTWVMLEASIVPSDFRSYLYSQRLVESLISSGACKNYIDRNFKRYLETKIQKSAWYFSCPMKYIFIHRKSRTAFVLFSNANGLLRLSSYSSFFNPWKAWKQVYLWSQLWVSLPRRFCSLSRKQDFPAGLWHSARQRTTPSCLPSLCPLFAHISPRGSSAYFPLSQRAIFSCLLLIFATFFPSFFLKSKVS